MNVDCYSKLLQGLQYDCSPTWYIEFEVVQSVAVRLVVSLVNLVFGLGKSVEASELETVCIIQNLVVKVPIGSHFVALVTIAWMEVKNKQ